jgi:tRNA (guanine37-N1)-methyltransferase
MKIDILSLFPGYFQGPFNESIVKRAQEKGILQIELVDIREYSTNRHRKVDDRPFGGGPGMVMMPQPLCDAIREAKAKSVSAVPHVIYLSPQGKTLTAAKCRELAEREHLILVCGHYEGIDERVVQLEVDEEISIGDYVLTNGCLPAIVLVDSVVRLIPGALGHPSAADEDSFERGILDCPHYTQPVVFEGLAVPDVAALEKTRQVRPDLLKDRSSRK